PKVIFFVSGYAVLLLPLGLFRAIMDRRSFKKKHGTTHRFGNRKRKSPMAKKSKKTSLPPPSFESARLIEAQFAADVLNARPSTSRPVTGVEDMASTSTDRTVQAHLQPNFVSTEESRECAAAVRESLSSVSATERKMNLTGEGQKPASAEPSDEYLVVQVAALNALLSETPCPKCFKPGVTVVQGTRLGLAVKMLLTCSTCGVVSNHWSSPRQEDSRAFEVNLRSMQAVKSVGKGATALTDFWSVMNVSHRGMHHKTFQGHLKSKFSPAADTAAAGVFTDAVNAVRKVYEEMDPTFTKNVTVIYDGTWMTRGHTSHIGVGTVIEYYTGLVLDSVVLSNLCHGCAVGPKPDAEGYSQWVQSHKCQRNTEVKSGRMEVEAALLLFGRSLAKNDLRYTNIVCDGDSRTFLALSEDATYGFIPFQKEDCINHVQKRMGSALRALITKGKKGQPLGGRGGLTQELIKRLTSYYGMALRSHPDVDEMQRAVMATFYHITSTDEEPHHHLCPPGPMSWCRHRAAEAQGEPQPAHKYKLASHVATALLPVYQRLSEPQLLDRCKGKKTQNAAESLHSVIWSVLPKDEHASLIAAETAVSEAICKFNCGSYRAYTEFCSSLGIRPGGLALRRAAEKDASRKKKASKALQAKGQKPKRGRAEKDVENYNPGGF
ncbi:unnamed protein product, partial [Ixodes pacificus]